MLNKLMSHSFGHYQVLFHELAFHNHNAHHLGTLFFLGATDKQMEKAYEAMKAEVDPYDPSPEPITLSNWRKFIGNKHFCKSYADFFHEQLKSSDERWEKKMMEFLLDNKEQPLINSVISGLVHPLIHIGYAFELDNMLVGVEALTMTAVCYNSLHETVDKLKPPSSPSKSPMEIFRAIRADTRLPVFEKPGADNIDDIVKDCNEILLSYLDQWKMHDDNPAKTMEELFDLSVYVYGATHKPDDIAFDFFLLHLLTGMNAVRTVQPHVTDPDVLQRLLMQYFYLAMIVYIAQLRPEIDEKLIHDYKIDAQSKNWDYAIDRSLTTALIEDAHLVKTVRALRDAERIYGDKNGLYLRTAVKTVDNVKSDDLWVGRADASRQLNVLKQS